MTAQTLSDLTRSLEKLGLAVLPAREVRNWFSVVNRQQIAMFHVVSGVFVSGWVVTARGRVDVDNCEQLLGAIKAVIDV